MKVGFRKPSIKKSIKARTTGRIKRSIKRTVNPMYGKKGMGWVQNPKKAMYNKIYHKTTFGVSDLIKADTDPTLESAKKQQFSAPPANGASPRTYKVCGVIMKIIAVGTALLFGLPGLFGGMYGLLIFAIIATFLSWKIGAVWSKRGRVSKEDMVIETEETEATSEDTLSYP